MTTRRILASTLATLATALSAICAPLAHATEYWLGGEDPVVQADKHKSDPADFMSLFEPGSAWQQSGAKVAVFKISTQFATRAPEDQLAKLIAGLRQRHIALAMETGMLYADKGCGRGEGYSPVGLLDKAMTRIQRAGGTLDYVAMDEIVFFGHEKNWPDQKGQVMCQDSIEELAKEVADRAQVIHKYFPGAKIGDIEPINSRIDVRTLVRDYLAFADQYQAATGSKLAFLHADIAWKTDWQPGMAPLKAGARARGIRFGTIFGGSPDNPSNEAWVAKGIERLQAIGSSSQTAPDDVVIQSWQVLPTKMLPETDPGSSTYLLREAERLIP